MTWRSVDHVQTVFLDTPRIRSLIAAEPLRPRTQHNELVTFRSPDSGHAFVGQI